MDLSSLEIFRTVVREGGVTRAAQQLNRVQSNVTTRIRQLEASLGVQLFVRESKRMVLTPAGQTLLTYADDILRLAAEARQAVQPREPHGRLRIASMESTAASRLPALLATLHQRWPRVQLELVTMTTRQSLQALSNFEVDCAFVAETACLNNTRAAMTTLPAFAEELVLIAHRAHPPIRRAADVQTAGKVSCGTNGHAVLNVRRWIEGAAGWDGDKVAYRQYLVNHEVGHLLGHGHEYCAGAGRLAPLMQQQSGSTGACLPNAWPFPSV